MQAHESLYENKKRYSEQSKGGKIQLSIENFNPVLKLKGISGIGPWDSSGITI